MCVWGRVCVKGKGTGIQGDSGRLEARGAGDRAQTSVTLPQGWGGPGQEGRGPEGREGGRGEALRVRLWEARGPAG